jgi:hypothetical protein
VVLDNGWSPVGLRKPPGKHLGGLKQFDFFFGANLLRQWENALMVLIVISSIGLQLLC